MASMEPGRFSVPCRNNAHVRCNLPDCLCECHDDEDDKPKTGTKLGEKKNRPEIDLEWEEPPSPKRHTSPAELLRPLIAELHQHPGKWARLCVYKAGNSAAMAAGQLRLKFSDVEFTTRRRDDGGSALYGRFVEADD